VQQRIRGAGDAPSRGEVWSAAHALRWSLEGAALSGHGKGSGRLPPRCRQATRAESALTTAPRR